MKLNGCTDAVQSTALYILHRIRHRLMPLTVIDYEREIEVDETYIVGTESNKHENKKLKLGVGTVNRTPAMR